jgi:hypothetical protein
MQAEDFMETGTLGLGSRGALLTGAGKFAEFPGTISGSP